MFEHFFLRPIFDIAKGPVARLLMSPVIGAAAVFLMMVMKHDEPMPGELWHWLAAGAAAGLLGGVVLTCIDVSRAASPERRVARARLAESIMQTGHAADADDALEQADMVLGEADERRVSQVVWVIALTILALGLAAVGIALLTR